MRIKSLVSTRWSNCWVCGTSVPNSGLSTSFEHALEFHQKPPKYKDILVHNDALLKLLCNGDLFDSAFYTQPSKRAHNKHLREARAAFQGPTPEETSVGPALSVGALPETGGPGRLNSLGQPAEVVAILLLWEDVGLETLGAKANGRQTHVHVQSQLPQTFQMQTG